MCRKPKRLRTATMRYVAGRIPHVRRYALVPNGSDNGIRRFHLARVASAPAARRLERMEDVAARDREDAERRSPSSDQAAS
jgi:hypothetical protein